jgi:hypothetical protein
MPHLHNPPPDKRKPAAMGARRASEYVGSKVSEPEATLAEIRLDCKAFSTGENLLLAKAKLLRAADEPQNFKASHLYFQKHNLDPLICADFAGLAAVVQVVDCGNHRFDFHEGHEDAFPAFVCEAFGDDGETTIDLVAWPLNRPEHVLTMFGCCGLLGLWEAVSAAGTVFNFPLPVHRTPLDWLQAECRGAAVVNSRLAGPLLLNIPAGITARDVRHGRELKTMLDAATPHTRVVVPDQIVSAA